MLMIVELKDLGDVLFSPNSYIRCASTFAAHAGQGYHLSVASLSSCITERFPVPGSSCPRLYPPPILQYRVGISSHTNTSATNGCWGWEIFVPDPVVQLVFLTLNPTLYHIASQWRDCVNTALTLDVIVNATITLHRHAQRILTASRLTLGWVCSLHTNQHYVNVYGKRN